MDIKDFSKENTSTVNAGFNKRRKWTELSEIIELYSKLNVDVFNHPKLLINGVSIDITLGLDNSAFFMYGNNENKTMFKLHEASLHVRECAVNPSLMLYHHQILNKNNYCLYPFKRSEIRTFTIVKGLTSTEINNVISGTLPNNFCMFMVTNESFSGNKQLNPYNFQHFNLKSVVFKVNGSPIYPTPLEFKDKQLQFSRMYTEFLKSSNAYLCEKNPIVQMEDFRKGHFIIPCSLSPRAQYDTDFCDDIGKEGTLSIDLTFSEATPDAITIFVYSEYLECLKIDKNLNVTL